MGEAICKENAAELAKLAHIARKRNREAMLAKMKEPSQAVTEELESEAYRKKRLSRVRVQLDRIDKMIQTEEDPGKLDRLASAISRLNEQERQLSNRSLPPTLKANAAPRRKPSAGSAGSEPEFVG